MNSAVNPALGETTGLAALSFLAGRAEDLSRFLAMTGVDLASFRAAAGQPETWAALLDFIMGEEALAMAFCEENRLTPEALAGARAALPGGDAPFWT